MATHPLPLTRAVLCTKFPNTLADLITGYTLSMDRSWYSVAYAGEYETCLHDYVNVEDCYLGACDAGHIEIVRLMLTHRPTGLKNGLYFACKNGWYVTAKHVIAECRRVGEQISLDDMIWIASANGHLKTVQMIISQESDTYSQAIYSACIRGRTRVFIMLLRYNRPFDHQRALEYACREGHQDIAALMLKRYTDIELAAPLKLVCIFGRMGLVTLLFAHGARASNKALECACHYGHIKIANYLIDHGANICDNHTHRHTMIGIIMHGVE